MPNSQLFPISAPLLPPFFPIFQVHTFRPGMTTDLLRLRLLRMRRQRLIDAAGHGATNANEGFSLMEFLLAVILITIVVSGTTVTLMANNRSGRPMDNADELERLIAQDLALIRELNSRFSCCGEECAEAAIPGGTPGACGSAALAAAENQRDACPDGGMAERMIAAFPEPPTAPPGVSLTRTGPTVSDTDLNRLQWTYTVSVDGVTMMSRVVNLIPDAVTGCR
jgi:type II secretory pathway pseudopilin PulG